MAVVMEYVAKTGAHITVLDDAYAGVSEEEMARRWQRVEEVARQIAINTELRRLKREAEEKSGK